MGDDAAGGTDVDGADALVSRVAAEHPAVPIASIRRLVVEELDRTAAARVQGFRLVLAERAVRARLATAPPVGDADGVRVDPRRDP